MSHVSFIAEMRSVLCAMVRKPKRRYHLEDIDLDDIILLKLFLAKELVVIL